MASILFVAWKRDLLLSAGSASAAVGRIGDYVLELFWRDGCEPTIGALLDYAQSGLRPAPQAAFATRLTPRVRPYLG
jgi:hypothetical protein